VRTGRVERLLKLIQAMQAGREYRVEELARLAAVSRRTVFRDLGLLQRAGMPYRYCRKTHRYWTEQAAVLPPVSLSPGEALSLLLAVRQHLYSGVAADAQVAASAALKLESMLPRVVQDYCQPRLRHMDVRPDPASDAESIADMLAILQSALLRTRKLYLRYDSYAERRQIEGRLSPYRLAYIHRGWYVIGRLERTDGSAAKLPGAGKSARRPLLFKVERIIDMKPLSDTYRADPGFSLDEYFGNAWLMVRGERSYHVKVRFLPLVAGNVQEVLWHKTQQTQYERDGSLLFEVDVDGIDEIAWWVLGYGDQAQVLEPLELRARMAEHAARMAEYYGNQDNDRGDKSSQECRRQK